MDLSDEFQSLDAHLQALAIRIAIRRIILSPIKSLLPSDVLSQCPDLGTFEETDVQKAIREAHQWLEQGIKERRAIEAKPYKPPIDYFSITRSVSG